MEGRVWPHVVEVGTLPWEVVLAWYGARLRVPGERHGVRLLLLVGVVLASASFWTTLLLRGYEEATVSGGFWKNFLSLVCTRCLHGEIWCITPLRPCIWQCIPQYLGVACGVRNIGFFGDDFVWRCNAWFDSGYGVLRQYLAFGRISHNFYV